MMKKQSQQTINKIFSQAQLLFKQGELTQSKSLYESLLTLHSSNTQSLTPSLHYNCFLNLSTIYMQQNALQKAESTLHKAIAFNSQRYEAFYNLSLVNFYSKRSLTKSVESLKHCLSLLYLDLGILTGSLKLLNKSISFYDQNVKAYIHRAIYYESNQKIKLASNQFEKLTFQDDEFQFSHQLLAEIYAQKALFFRRNRNTQKMEESMIMYHKHRKEAKGEKNKLPEKIAYILSHESTKITQNFTDQAQMKQTIKSMLRQVQELIEKIKQERKKQTKSRTVEQSVQEKISALHNQSIQKLTPKIVEKFEPKKEESLLEEQILEPSQNSMIQKDQNSLISINEDEDSAILNQKIQELQRQIKQSGGNVPEIKDLSRNSEQQNFLEFEIEKTLEEINTKKKEGESKPKTTTDKIPDAWKSGISERKISSSDVRDTLSMRSRLTQVYEIDLEEMKNYKSFILEIRSVTMFEENSPRKESFVKVMYLSHEMLTEKCKNDKFTWNHNFEETTIKHSIMEDSDDDNKYKLSIEVHAKEGGWLSWSTNVLLATGVIKLNEKGTTKCTLENNGKKVGMLYYKIKLHKFEQQKQ